MNVPAPASAPASWYPAASADQRTDPISRSRQTHVPPFVPITTSLST
jgi:hypothetical protein